MIKKRYFSPELEVVTFSLDECILNNSNYGDTGAPGADDGYEDGDLS